METLKDIVVIYHGQCKDGFGAAYAAWKKFHDTASYIPRKTQTEIPEGLTGKEIYILDYSYPKETLEALISANRSVMVIDHHETAREAVTSLPGNVFDLSHSGAVLAWNHFHPGTQTPRLLLYVEDQDLWKNQLPKTRAFGAALGEAPFTFEAWDHLAETLEDEASLAGFIATGETIARFEEGLIERLLAFKEKVSFEGQSMYAINCSRLYRSILGHKLATQNEREGGIGMAIVYYHYEGAFHCSLRSNGEVDVRAIAEKFGGGGHKNAASFEVRDAAHLPFSFL